MTLTPQLKVVFTHPLKVRHSVNKFSFFNSLPVSDIFCTLLINFAYSLCPDQPLSAIPAGPIPNGK